MTARLIIDNTHRPVAVADYPIGIRFVPHVPVPTPMGGWPRSGPARHIVIGAMPSARALVLRNQSLRLFSLRASVAIAAICVLYFGAEFLR